MKKLVLFFIFFEINVLFSQNTLQNLEEISNQQEIKNQKENFEYERVYLEIGMIKPLGKLNNKFQTSHSFGFWFRNKIKENEFFDVGFSFFIPQHAANVSFVTKDSVFSLRNKKFGGNIGFRFAKIFPFSAVKTGNNIEMNTGFGLASLIYDANHKRFADIQNNEYDTTDSKTSYDFLLTTFFVSQGIKINFKNVGLQCNYQYSPYSLFEKRVESNFGSHSLWFGIYYRQ